MCACIHNETLALTVTPSSSPVMPGGVNVAAAIAIPVVLVLLLLLVIGVVVVGAVLLLHRKKGLG